VCRFLQRIQGGLDAKIASFSWRVQKFDPILVKPSKGMPQPPQSLDYPIYVQERELLTKNEQANFENCEKSILTLSAAFLAFSVSFLGLLPKRESSPLHLISTEFLIWSWFLFALSVACILICFLVNAVALRSDVRRIERALKDIAALNGGVN
jgi:hypothetical protein